MKPSLILQILAALGLLFCLALPFLITPSPLGEEGELAIEEVLEAVEPVPDPLAVGASEKIPDPSVSPILPQPDDLLKAGPMQGEPTPEISVMQKLLSHPALKRRPDIASDLTSGGNAAVPVGAGSATENSEVATPMILSLANFYAQIIHPDGTPASGIGIEALPVGVPEPLRTLSDPEGRIIISGLPMHTVFALEAVSIRGERQRLGGDILADRPILSGGVYVWDPKATFTVKVRALGLPLRGASVTLTDAGLSPMSRATSEEGRAVFDGLTAVAKPILSIFHPLYERIETPLEPGAVRSGTRAFDLVPRSGVDVHLVGPDFSRGLHVRSWMATQKASLLLPDELPGNACGEILYNGALRFSAPPAGPFWIGVGELPAPWGAGLYGPYYTTAAGTLEIRLEETGPLEVRLRNERNPKWWNVLLSAVDLEHQAAAEMRSDLLTGPTSPPLHLAPGHYRLQVLAEDREIYDEVFLHDGRARTLEVLLQPRPPLHLLGGAVGSYLVSSSFSLAASEHDFHHGPMCHSFNKDLLAHLGGEAVFAAANGARYPALDPDAEPTAWREAQTDNDGQLDLKKAVPGGPVDYAVAYAQFEVESFSARNILLGVMSDGGIQGWLNGELVFRTHAARPLSAQDHEFAQVRLRPGRNRFNFKVDHAEGPWRLRVRLLRPTTAEPLPDLNYFPDGGTTPLFYPSNPPPVH